jgi:cobalamin biosynthesis protein CobT
MSRNIIQSAIPILARSIGQKMSVKVKFGAHRASTDGKVIYLPNLPIEDEASEALSIGYTIHEAGHIRFSDFSIGVDVKPVSDLHAALWGRMEDARMEKEVIDNYPGAKNKLIKLVDELIKADFLTAPGPSSSAADALTTYVLYELRSSLLGQSSLAPYAKTAFELLETHMTEGCLTRTVAILSCVRTAKTEREVFDLAADIVKVIEEESKDNPPPPEDDNQSEPESESDESKSKPNESDSDSEDQDESKEGASKPGDNSGKDGNQTPENADARKKASMQEMLNADEGDFPADMMSGAEQLLGDAIEEAVQQGNGCIPGDGRADSPPLPLGDHKAVYNSARESSAALRTRLLSLVQSSKRVKRSVSSRGRRIDGRKVVRVKQNNPNIFKSASRKKAVNTTVQILLDRSGSMHHSMDLACRSTLAIAAALDDIPGLTVAASAFPGRNNDVEPMTFMNESVRSTAARYPAIHASGGTPLLPALMWSAHQLLAQKEERKILLVITDGMPKEPENCINVINRMINSDIEVHGLGIGVEHITSLIPNSRCIQDGSELASTMFSIFQTSLTH